MYIFLVPSPTPPANVQDNAAAPNRPASITISGGKFFFLRINVETLLLIFLFLVNVSMVVGSALVAAVGSTLLEFIVVPFKGQLTAIDWAAICTKLLWCALLVGCLCFSSHRFNKCN